MDKQENFRKLLHSDNKKFKDMKDVISILRKNMIRMPDIFLEYGVKLLSKFRNNLGDEYYLIVEELFYAALDCQKLDFAKKCFDHLKEKFGTTSPKIQRMFGIFAESSGSEETAKIFDSLAAENPLHLETQKRKIAYLRVPNHIKFLLNEGEGKKVEAITELNKYLEANMNDKEAWLELADIYLESLDYLKALYCYEQVLLQNPKNIHYHIKIAEIYYTLGGAENLSIARGYYSLAIAYLPKNLMALYGLMQTCRGLEKLKKNDDRNKQLLDLCQKNLKKLYEKSKNSEIFGALSKK